MRLRLFGRMASLVAIGALLGGCSDSIPADLEQVLERDTDFYINVRIATPAEAGTRGEGDESNTNTAAGDYVNGLGEEQEIHKILFVFYNSDRQYVGNATYEPTTAQGVTENPNTAGSLETILNITVPVSVAAGSTKPAYVMAYVNPTLKAEKDLLVDYNTALGAFRELEDVVPHSSTTGTHKGFAMNNSVHYEAESNNERPTIAIAIDQENQLATSAEAAAGKSPVVIYVERVVAKVTVDKGTNITETNNTVKGDDGVTTYTLNFTPLAWGLSNLEKATFLIKNFRTDYYGNPTSFESPLSFTNYQYGQLNSRLNDPNDETKSLTNPSWNFPGGNPAEEGTNWGISGHRTFWALSPTYYHDDDLWMPTYSDQIYGTGKNDNASPLKYRSFNDIYNVSGTTAKMGTYGKTFGTTQYTLEHTMQASVVTDYQKRAVTCAVVVGKYTLTEGSTGVTYDNFYLRKIMTEDGPTTIIYPSDDEMKKAFLAKNSTVFIKNDNPATMAATPYIPVPSEKGEGGNPYYADFVIEHPVLESPVPSRYVTLRLKRDFTAGRYFYQNDAGAYVAVTAENRNVVNSDLYNNMIGQLGGIEEYHSGYAYFEVPVKHLWGTSKDPEVTYKEIGDDGFVARLGQYGIVRNHAYNIKVTGIDGIGIGISDPNAPIIPNVENDTYHVKTEIRVQRWRVVPTQNVTLKP